MVRITCLILSTVVGSVSFGPDWTDDYGEALSNARCAHRPMVVVLENPEKTKERAGSIFHVERKLLTKFEICRVDVGSDYGKQVAELYSPSELPYTVITDSKCDRIVYRGVGERTIGQWRATLEDHADKGAGASESPKKNQTELASAKRLEIHRSSLYAPFTQGDLNSARDAAGAGDRRLLVYVSMDQCPYCDKMQDETFSSSDVVLLLHDDMESVMIRKEEQLAFVEQHGIRIFPATVILSPDGDELTKIEGFVPPEVFQSRVNAAK